MSGGSEDGEGMKPVDSGEGKKRDIEDADALELDGFTILDAESESSADSNATEDATDAEKTANANADTSDTDTDTGDTETDSGDTDTEESSDTDADSPTAVDVASDEGTADEAAADGDGDGDGDGGKSGELSFDEWLAAAEIPTDDAAKPAETDKSANGGDAAATGRSRKKNRRSRRSRKKSGGTDADSADKTSSDKSNSEKTGPDKVDPEKVDQDKVDTAAVSAAGSDENEVVGTSMSEIMAELLAAAEQSSLDRPDDGVDALDTEVELDPEATSEFASAGGSDSTKTVSAAIAAAKASSPTEGDAEKDSADSDASKTDSDAEDSALDEADAKADKNSKPADAGSKDDSKPENKKTADPDTEDAESKDSGNKDSESKDSQSEDSKSKDKDSKDADKKDAESKTSKDGDSKDDKSKDKDPKDKDPKDRDAKDKDAKDKDSKDKDSKDKDSKSKDTEDKQAATSTSPVESKTSSPTVAPLRRPEKSSNVPIAAIAIIAPIVVLYAILVVGWALDSAAHSGEAMRGVRVANVGVGGSNEEALGEVFDTLDADLEAIDLTVSVDDVDINTDPFSLGVRHDREPMIDQALAARRGGFIAFRPIRWLFHLFTSEDIPARYIIDSAQAADGAEDIIIPELDQPVEPEIELRGSQMALVSGADGVAVDPDEIVDQLPGIVDGSAPYELALTAESASPELTDDAVAAVVDEINEQTEQPILAQVLDQEAEVSPRTLKTWMVLDDDDGEPTWSIDEEMALEDLKPLFPALGSEDQQARFSVVDGEPIIIPASETVICCEEGTLVSLGAAIKRNIPDPIEPPEGSPEDAEPIQQLRRARLEPAITGNDEGVAELESLGIVEEISTFTTPHACCQNRVINIQRFADLTQGVIIRPGEEFSLNEFVGQRTREKGFVADGAIVLGNFEPQVGGGISQYATTFFNASFFAGIEFLEYQSHSIYISRYPRGREATISWRRPDLKVLNNTDYGILVWNEYTDTSITVTFYSTKNREVEALPLLRSSDRQCRIDITPRVITFEDGTTQEDSVRAIYRPGQGLDCNGNSTTPEEDPPPPANNATPDPPAPDPDPGDGEVLPPGE